MKGIPSGRTPWNKGKRMTDEQKAKLNTDGLRLGHGWNKGIPPSEEARRKNGEAHKGLPAWNKGIPCSEESKKKMSESHMGIVSWNKGKKQPEITGPNHYNWKGGIASESAKLRTTYEYKAWRLMVFHRDWFSCRYPGCNHMGRGIEAHHIVSVSENQDLIFDVNNGITLCIKHHNETRKKENNFIGIFTEVLKEKVNHGHS
jgi:hypothetical protein